MSRHIFKQIAVAEPVDRTARTVVSRGSHYEPQRTALRNNWFSECPEIVPLPADQPQFVDMSGVVYRGMKVVGYAGTSTGGGGAVWACSCPCGRYMRIRAARLRSFMRRNQDDLLCDVCDNLRAMRDHGKPSRFGKEGGQAA